MEETSTTIGICTVAGVGVVEVVAEVVVEVGDLVRCRREKNADKKKGY